MPEPKDPFQDPFTPEIHRITFGNGDNRRTVIDAVATAESYSQAQLPELSTSQVLAGDKLTVDFDDGSEIVCDITSVEPGEMWFGSESLEHPEAKMRVHSSADTGGQLPSGEVEFRGSHVLSGGGLFMPGRWCVENYMEFFDGKLMHTTVAAIKGFRLQRPDADGNLSDVRLNQNQNPEKSQSFTDAVEAFKTMEQQLVRAGYDMNEPGTDELGHRLNFVRNVNGTHVSAYSTPYARDPEYRVFTHTVANQAFHAMRYIPSLGVMQVATLRDVTPAMFAKEVNTSGDPYSPDAMGLEYASDMNVSRLSKLTPATTYTWQNPAVDKPVVEVSFDSSLAGTELDEAQVGLGNVPAYESVGYCAGLEVADSQVIVRPSPTYRLRKHPEAYADIIATGTQAHLDGTDIDFRFGKVGLRLETVPTDVFAEMVAAVSEATASPSTPEKRSKLHGFLNSFGLGRRPK